MENLKTYVAKKWQAGLFSLAIFVAGVATGIFITHQAPTPSNLTLHQLPVPSNPALALTIVPTSLSADSIRRGREFKTTFSFVVCV